MPPLWSPWFKSRACSAHAKNETEGGENASCKLAEDTNYTYRYLYICFVPSYKASEAGTFFFLRRRMRILSNVALPTRRPQWDSRPTWLMGVHDKTLPSLALQA